MEIWTSLRLAHIPTPRTPLPTGAHGPDALRLPLTLGVSEFLCKRYGLQLTEMRSPN